MGFRDRGTAQVPDQVNVTLSRECVEGCRVLHCHVLMSPLSAGHLQFLGSESHLQPNSGC